MRAQVSSGASRHDIGGGVGVLDFELLGSGVGSATLVDASPAYLDAAGHEAEARKIADRLQRVIGDFAALGEGIESADIVTTHRVVCCYPDPASLLTKRRERASRDNVTNVDAVLGATEDPRLEAGCFDAVLNHNAYHEMTEREAMLRHIRAALKPGGRLLIVEPMHESSRGVSREKQVEKHDIEIDIVDQELRTAGFEIVERDTEFVKFSGVAGGFWRILARRP